MNIENICDLCDDEVAVTPAGLCECCGYCAICYTEKEEYHTQGYLCPCCDMDEDPEDDEK